MNKNKVRGIRPGAKKPLNQIYRIRLTEEQKNLVHSGGTVESYRTALVNQARKNVGISIKPNGFNVEIVQEKESD